MAITGMTDYDDHCDRLEGEPGCSQCGEDEDAIRDGHCTACGSYERCGVNMDDITEVMDHPPEGCMTTEEQMTGPEKYEALCERVFQEATEELDESTRYLLALKLVDSLSAQRRTSVKTHIDAVAKRRVQELEQALADERKAQGPRVIRKRRAAPEVKS